MGKNNQPTVSLNTAFSQHQQDWEVSRPRPLVAKNQGV